MTRRAGAEDLELLLIDGDNLLHSVRGTRDESGVAWLLPRLRRWRPAHLHVVVGLDGHAAPGEASRQRVAPGIEFHHSGSRSADDLLVELLGARPYAERSRTAVVTADRALQTRARRAAASTRSVDWLLRQLMAPSTGAGDAAPVGIGQGRRARSGPADIPEEAERQSWRPGRGATTKRGNPRRSPKATRRR